MAAMAAACSAEIKIRQESGRKSPHCLHKPEITGSSRLPSLIVATALTGKPPARRERRLIVRSEDTRANGGASAFFGELVSLSPAPRFHEYLWVSKVRGERHALIVKGAVTPWMFLRYFHCNLTPVMRALADLPVAACTRWI